MKQNYLSLSKLSLLQSSLFIAISLIEIHAIALYSHLPTFILSDYICSSVLCALLFIMFVVAFFDNEIEATKNLDGDLNTRHDQDTDKDPDPVNPGIMDTLILITAIMCHLLQEKISIVNFN